jgi:leucyl-tRNA synthetase
LVAETIEIPIQIKGKLRSKVVVAADADETTVTSAALSDPRIVELLAGAEPKKVIYVPGRLVNLIV